MRRHRTGADVTRVVQRLFDREADLFPIRPQGGAYFVPAAHAPLVDKVQALPGRLNGQVLRFPVPRGTDQGDRSVKEAVAAGLAALISEHRQAVAAYGADTRPGTVERAAEKIRQTQFKVESYAQYLAEERLKLERDLVQAHRELRLKVEALATSEPTAAS